MLGEETLPRVRLGPWVAPIVAAVLLVSSIANAEPSANDRALATALFREGRDLLTQGKIREACEKLAESQRLDPAGGTLLNLARCHEQQGRIATAWTEFNEARAIARRDRRSDREAEASVHIEALEPRLSRLTILVPDAARVAGLEIRRDGTALGPATWSTPMPVDGGDHVIEVTAPGKVAVRLEVYVGPERDTRKIEVPVLADAPPEPVKAPAPQQDAPMHPRAILGFTVGAVGIAEIGVGIFFGVRAFQLHAESDEGCPDGRCTTVGVEREVDAGRAADASTALISLGVVSAALGLTLVLTAPSPQEPEVPPVEVAFAPGALSFRGSF